MTHETSTEPEKINEPEDGLLPLAVLEFYDGLNVVCIKDHDVSGTNGVIKVGDTGLLYGDYMRETKRGWLTVAWDRQAYDQIEEDVVNLYGVYTNDWEEFFRPTRFRCDDTIH